MFHKLLHLISSRRLLVFSFYSEQAGDEADEVASSKDTAGQW